MGICKPGYCALYSFELCLRAVFDISFLLVSHDSRLHVGVLDVCGRARYEFR